MVKKVLEMLKTELVEHSKVRPNPLDISQWKRGHYNHLSNLINQEIANSEVLTEKEKNNIGTTISTATLLKIFKYGYLIKEDKDTRQIKTLSKLAIFLGYRDWYAYFDTKSNEIPTEEEIKGIIESAMKCELDAYQTLPNIKTTSIKQIFIENSSAYNRIVSLLNTLSTQQWTLSNKLNPSTSELLNINLKSVSSNEIQVESEEYWYLRWYDLNTEKYTFIYNQKNEQLYVLTKTPEGWKVKVNFYESKEGGKSLD